MRQEDFCIPTLSIHQVRVVLGRECDLDKPAHFGQGQLLESHQSPAPSPSSWGHEHLRPEGGASGWYTVVSTTVVSKMTCVKCLVEFLMLLNSQGIMMIAIFLLEDLLKADPMELARWLDEYDVAGEWYGLGVQVKGQ